MRGVRILAWMLIGIAAPLCSQQVPLVQLIGHTTARLEWDPYRQQGEIADGANVLSFRLGSPLFLLNHSETKALGEIGFPNGQLVVTAEAAEYITNLFPVDTAAKQGRIPKRHVSTIFLDPGHGGRDPGAISTQIINGKPVTIEEKDVVLRVSKMVFAELAAHYPDKKIATSRDGDTYLALEARTEAANAIPRKPNDSTVFVSIHANASLRKATRGFEVWFLPPEYRRTLLQPSDVSQTSVEVLPILNSMLEEEYTIESVLLAKSILGGMDEEVGTLSPRLGLKENSWAVVRNAKMPSVLVEIGFITNPIEGLRLSDDAYLRKIAMGIYNGVVRYVTAYEQSNSPE
ncbi:MAG TPA: N-acetylmuramoyl-L-alanine amidase [Spirochaetia bacterium]|nr:N-acetylmuramoyl-L-alanine amidase [Spirochaetia bacterium]